MSLLNTIILTTHSRVRLYSAADLTMPFTVVPTSDLKIRVASPPYVYPISLTMQTIVFPSSFTTHNRNKLALTEYRSWWRRRRCRHRVCCCCCVRRVRFRPLCECAFFSPAPPTLSPTPGFVSLSFVCSFARRSLFDVSETNTPSEPPTAAPTPSLSKSFVSVFPTQHCWVAPPSKSTRHSAANQRADPTYRRPLCLRLFAPYVVNTITRLEFVLSRRRSSSTNELTTTSQLVPPGAPTNAPTPQPSPPPS